ncbi:MAG: carbon storage regulator CsrA [Candidatus Brocadiia bacterium]
MLVLTRRKGESIVLGDSVEIHVLEISRHQVKLGVQAPRAVPVYRKEIYDQIREENRAAASSSDSQVLGIGKLFGT